MLKDNVNNSVNNIKELKELLSFLEIANNFLTDDNDNDDNANMLVNKYVEEAFDDNLKIAFFKNIFDNKEVNWENCQEKKYYVIYSNKHKRFVTSYGCFNKIPGVIYFSTVFTAEMCANWLNYAKDVENE